MVMGFAPDVDGESQARITNGLLQAFEHYAQARHCSLLALKEVPAHQEALWQRVAWPRGYRAVRGLPSAALAVNFTSMEEYLSGLSQGTRRDMRRKLRSRAVVRVERRHNIDDVMTSINELYTTTRERADLQFEELTPAFFQGVLARVPGASCVLYYANDQLLAMNLLLEDRATLLDKFFCMNADLGRAYNLYFLSWFRNVEYCLSHGLTRYLSGQAGYGSKLRLGSTLTETFLFFRHRNALVNWTLRIVAPLFTRSLHPECGS
jgi:predicted N-acyltransferase